MLRVLLLMALARLSVSTFDPELHEKYLQLPRHQFIEHFNKQNFSWKITNYPHLENIDLNCDTTDESIQDLEIKSHDPKIYSQLPDNFDPREHWDDCPTIKEIYDQGFCGSCWAFASVTLASDRTCIRKGLVVRLSEQDLTCVKPICFGGSSTDALGFWKDKGLVTLECRPYDISKHDVCEEKCIDSNIDYAKDKHFAEEIYAVSSNDNDIRAELFTNGPVYAGFDVYGDFQHYTSGVYEHQFGTYLGRHGVRVLGYGIENGIDFWMVANSWGSSWGENGFFKIKRHQELLGFEEKMYTGLAKS
ncbi:hypothetical protein O3G_MSEX002905 [Manduca sexta]|uniref:Peptidase C1A papain C-terminal domain-containing protein n=1 Tax=Manduca sexta TaxID=7130 RepID=A0A921YQC0_MANSE|nr:hypothetical protein O3G_MSEX002905 [Manduca sexta]KAG6443549.1 hypothetical protein O3G_MSEX002905 [Manduca sexta]